MKPEQRISGLQGLARLSGALLGRPMTKLFLELTGGRSVSVNERSGNVLLRGDVRLRGFVDQGLEALGLVAGDSATVGILRPKYRPMTVDQGLFRHPDSIMAVRTGYYDERGQELPSDKIISGELDSVRHLVAVSNFRGSSRLSDEYDVYEHVVARARHHISEEVGNEWVFNMD